MAYSMVISGPIKMSRRSEQPTIDGGAVVQEMGYTETVVYRFFWITIGELQQEIEMVETAGWIISGDVAPTPVAEPLEIYNVQFSAHRYVA